MGKYMKSTLAYFFFVLVPQEQKAPAIAHALSTTRRPAINGTAGKFKLSRARPAALTSRAAPRPQAGPRVT